MLIVAVAIIENVVFDVVYGVEVLRVDVESNAGRCRSYEAEEDKGVHSVWHDKQTTTLLSPWR
jgi:hypothetical protein